MQDSLPVKNSGISYPFKTRRAPSGREVSRSRREFIMVYVPVFGRDVMVKLELLKAQLKAQEAMRK